jgi:hypothetical protein
MFVTVTLDHLPTKPKKEIKKTMFASLLPVVLTVALSPSAFAVQDSNFYYTGFVNPNTENEMYWKDSVNVLQDLDQFSALYIKHHGCV